MAELQQVTLRLGAAFEQLQQGSLKVEPSDSAT
jgi:hypothetical protein